MTLEELDGVSGSRGCRSAPQPQPRSGRSSTRGVGCAGSAHAHARDDVSCDVVVCATRILQVATIRIAHCCRQRPCSLVPDRSAGARHTGFAPVAFAVGSRVDLASGHRWPCVVPRIVAGALGVLLPTRSGLARAGARVRVRNQSQMLAKTSGSAGLALWRMVRVQDSPSGRDVLLGRTSLLLDHVTTTARPGYR